MISIIISSANKTLLKEVSENIAETIGVPYEIIAINNSSAELGICAVYNKGMLKAQYDTLCFMHEDIHIKTNNWGQTILSSFKNDPELGLIGVAGTTYITLSPSSWGGGGINTIYTNIMQSFKHKEKAPALDYRNPKNEKISRVACVDGVWLCTTKTVTNNFKFDEDTFKGFHGYDIDFSLAVGQKYKVAVSFEILINHFSEGLYDKSWMGENLKLHNKWHHILPVNLEELTPEAIFYIEKNAFKAFTEQLIKFGYSMFTAYKVLWKNNRFLKLNPKLFLKLQYYIMKKYLTVDKNKAALND